MSIIIWEPPQYQDGYPYHSYSDLISGGTYIYINPALKQGIAGLAKTLREVPRFTGWTQDYYAGTGEFEILVDGADVEPADIKAGNIVRIDGRDYEIETYSVELTESGYMWTLSGRDMGGFLDRWLDQLSYSENNRLPTTIQEMVTYYNSLMAPRMGFYGGNAKSAINGCYSMCGWVRGSSLWTRTSFENDGTASKTVSPPPSQVMTYSASLRTMCNLFKIGYRMKVVIQSNSSPVSFLELYDRADKGIELRSTGRGISGYKYEYDERNAVNTVCVYSNINGAGMTTWFSKVNTDASLKSSAARANAVRCVAKDLGDVPEEYTTDWGTAYDWLYSQNVSQEYVPAEESVTFNYDNSGQYKYGVDFFLGSPVTITDDYTGISTKQTLTGVRTTYGATGEKEYSFDFGSQRITHNDVLKRMLAALDYKAGLGRTYNQA